MVHVSPPVPPLSQPLNRCGIRVGGLPQAQTKFCCTGFVFVLGIARPAAMSVADELAKVRAPPSSYVESGACSLRSFLRSLPKHAQTFLWKAALFSAHLSSAEHHSFACSFLQMTIETLYKESKDTKLGITFFRRDPQEAASSGSALISRIGASGPAAGKLQVGERVMTVQGVPVEGPLHAARMLRESEGFMKIGKLPKRADFDEKLEYYQQLEAEAARAAMAATLPGQQPQSTPRTDAPTPRGPGAGASVPAQFSSGLRPINQQQPPGGLSLNIGEGLQNTGAQLSARAMEMTQGIGDFWGQLSARASTQVAKIGSGFNKVAENIPTQVRARLAGRTRSAPSPTPNPLLTRSFCFGTVAFVLAGKQGAQGGAMHPEGLPCVCRARPLPRGARCGADAAERGAAQEGTERAAVQGDARQLGGDCHSGELPSAQAARKGQGARGEEHAQEGHRLAPGQVALLLAAQEAAQEAGASGGFDCG